MFHIKIISFTQKIKYKNHFKDLSKKKSFKDYPRPSRVTYSYTKLINIIKIIKSFS